jgi:anthranilate/para-aminobenzoate synthase component I
VRAMELIAELEKEKRGVYAGAVGYFGYGSVDGDKEIEGAMDVSCKLPQQQQQQQHNPQVLIYADVHCSPNHACERRGGISPGRGKCGKSCF